MFLRCSRNLSRPRVNTPRMRARARARARRRSAAVGDPPLIAIALGSPSWGRERGGQGMRVFSRLPDEFQ